MTSVVINIIMMLFAMIVFYGFFVTFQSIVILISVSIHAVIDIKNYFKRK